jgi:tripartite-type tricarboxylate transporter receptor subunit TctC
MSRILAGVAGAPRRGHPGFVVAAVVMALGLSAGAGAQNYPAKPIRMIVPTAAGGGSDLQARLLAKAFHESLGQPVVVENRPGASGTIGAELAAKAPPDGYTVFVATALLSTNGALYKKLAFDPVRDLAPVGLISFAPQFLIAHPSVPARSARELAALAKKHPGKINAGSSGTGSANHLALEMFKQRAGIDVTHIPYKSGSPAVAALMSGEVDFTFTGAVTALPPVRAGRVRALAVTSRKSSSLLPEVPTMDSIYPGFESANWYALFVPAGTPGAVVNRLNGEMLKALKSREMLEFMAREGAEPVGSTPQELGTHFRREVERYSEVIRRGKIQVE